MSKSVFYNSFLTVIRQVLSIIFGLLAMIIIARTLGSSGQGQYTLAILLPTLLYTLLNSGLSISTVFYIGQKKYSDDEIYSTNIITALLLSVLSIIIGLIIIHFFKEYFFESLTNKLLLYTLLIVPLLFTQKNLQTIFQGKEDFEKFNLIVILNQLGLLLFSVLFVLVLDLGVFGAVLSFALSQLLMLFASFYFLKVYYNLLMPNRISINYAKESFIFGLKGHISSVLSFINYRIDIFIIAYFMDDIAVGLYSVAVLISERIWLVSQSVSSVLFARVANMSDDSERTKFTSLASRNTLLITLIGGIFLAFISHWFINLFFGESYSQSVIPFIYLIPGVIIFSMSKVLANDFIGRGYPEINTYIAFVTALCNLGLNFWLIPIYGIKGAAIATTSSYILDALMKSFYFSFKNNISFSEFYIFKSSDLKLYKAQFNKYLKR
jgi:O-antigen/teichoic acid export membrane protein